MKTLFKKTDFSPPELLKIKSLTSIIENIPKSSKWMKILRSFSETEDFSRLEEFLISEYSSNYCFPKPDQIFRSLQLTPFENVRVVILGQDPYHGMGQADGLAFSVPNGVNPPPSLRNIIIEMGNDIGEVLRSTDLSSLSAQGVLLLNTCLTVRNSEAGSHREKGWETLTSENQQELPVYLANKMIEYIKENKKVKEMSNKWNIKEGEIRKHITKMARYITEGIIDVIE